MTSFSGVMFLFVLLRFRLCAFVEAAALRSIVLRYAGAPIATRVFYSFFWRCRFFRVFIVPFPLSLLIEFRVRGRCWHACSVVGEENYKKPDSKKTLY